MTRHIDEITIEFDKIQNDTVKFYENLGLIVMTGADSVDRSNARPSCSNSKSIKLCSTRSAKIESFDGTLTVSVERDIYNTLPEIYPEESILFGESFTFSKKATDGIGTSVRIISRSSFPGIRIGVLTSGGDSPGMNSAVRSVIRYSLNNDIKIFGIYRGFDGLIRGDIRKLGWNNETHGSGYGGTYLLSARSERFKTREGRKSAALNLFARNINALIVIGGEGSMEGAMVLKGEFKELCRELVEDGTVDRFVAEQIKRRNSQKQAILNQRINKDGPTAQNINPSNLSDSVEQDLMLSVSSLSTEKISDILLDYTHDEGSEEFNTDKELYDLKIVGIPGTIDNDLIGTELTLGSNTAITRIAEVVDKLNSTMRSHKRVFVVECMGRNCGWLTLMAGFAVEAEYLIIPEVPRSNWKDEMVQSLRTAYYNHKSNILVLLCEGAIEPDGRKIATKEVVETIKNAGISVRSMILGHIQRGGTTAAQDRFLGTISGIKAVEYIITGSEKPVMISSQQGRLVCADLHEVVEQTRRSLELFRERRFEEVFSMRSASFQNIYTLYEQHRARLVSKFYKEHLYPREVSIGSMHANLERKLNSESNTVISVPDQKIEARRLRIGILADTQNCGGMNTILNSLVQCGITQNADIFYCFDGFSGFLDKNLRKADIFEFCLCHNEGGVVIGTSNGRVVNKDMVAANLDELKLDILIVMGNTGSLKIASECSRIIVIPSMTTNDVPGTDKSIGADTSVNAILKASEACRLVSISMKRTMLMIEVSGKSGYLTVMSGIASGAFEVLNPESTKMEDLVLIRKRISAVFKQQQNSVVIYRNSGTFGDISTESLCKILCSDAEIEYKFSVLGHLETGTAPSVIDRINARLSAFKAIEECLRQHSSGEYKSGVVGISSSQAIFTEIEKVLENYDQENETVKNPAWLEYSKTCTLLE